MRAAGRWRGRCPRSRGGGGVGGDDALDLSDALGCVEVDVGPEADSAVLVADGKEADLVGAAEPGCSPVGELVDRSALGPGHPGMELADQSGAQVGESYRLRGRVGDGSRAGIRCARGKPRPVTPGNHS